MSHERDLSPPPTRTSSFQSTPVRDTPPLNARLFASPRSPEPTWIREVPPAPIKRRLSHDDTSEERSRPTQRPRAAVNLETRFSEAGPAPRVRGINVNVDVLLPYFVDRPELSELPARVMLSGRLAKLGMDAIQTRGLQKMRTFVDDARLTPELPFYTGKILDTIHEMDMYSGLIDHLVLLFHTATNIRRFSSSGGSSPSVSSSSSTLLGTEPTRRVFHTRRMTLLGSVHAHLHAVSDDSASREHLQILTFALMASWRAMVKAWIEYMDMCSVGIDAAREFLSSDEDE